MKFHNLTKDYRTSIRINKDVYDHLMMIDASPQRIIDSYIKKYILTDKNFMDSVKPERPLNYTDKDYEVIK